MATQDDVRSDLAALADECERIVAPSRELDAAIAKAVGYEVEWATIGPDHRREELVQVRTYPGEAAPTSRNLRRYTASIDAAMTLVPEGWVESYQRRFDGTTRASCYQSGTGEQTSAEAATPALALTAAALRARVHLPTTEDDNG